MCGLVGTINNNTNINKLIQSISHRGPDDKGSYLGNNIHIGFNRLSIIDLSKNGHQPMSNENKSIWIIFNGEIYNYKEIKPHLERKHKFNSNTDTEVLIHGYEEYGIENLIEKLNGMYAFALLDLNKKCIYLARDEIGKKPLYYYKKNHKIIAFASETKAFFHLNDFSFNIDNNAFELFLGYPYLPNNDKTIIKNVYKVPPNSYIKINYDGTYKITYSKNLNLTNTKPLYTNVLHNIEDLLTKSIKYRLHADVPVGVLLSGGLDSSLITAIASKHSNKKIETINISFKDTNINESKYARIVANHCNTKHTELLLDSTDLYHQFKSNIQIYDDITTTDPGMFSTYLLSQKVRDLGIKVILVGEGADEVFGGYTWFQLSQVPFSFLPNTIKTFLYHYAIMRKLPSFNYMKYPIFMNKLMNKFPGDYFQKIRQFEIHYSLPNHYCMKIDKASAAASIEARLPYLDKNLVSYTINLPKKYFLKSEYYLPYITQEKHILRLIARSYLPQSIVNRKKRGGMLPSHLLLEAGLNLDKEEILSNKLVRDYFNTDKLYQLMMKNNKYSIMQWQREWILWKLLTFTLWYSYFNNYAKTKL